MSRAEPNNLDLTTSLMYLSAFTTPFSTCSHPTPSGDIHPYWLRLRVWNVWSLGLIITLLKKLVLPARWASWFISLMSDFCWVDASWWRCCTQECSLLLAGDERTQLRHLRRLIYAFYCSMQRASTALVSSLRAPLPISAVSGAEQHPGRASFEEYWLAGLWTPTVLSDTVSPTSSSVLLMSTAVIFRLQTAILAICLSVWVL